MTFVASVTGSGTGSSNDASSTLNIQAGDVLVTFVAGNTGNTAISTVQDTSGNNSHTVLGETTPWFAHEAAYCLNGDADASATIRVTLAASANGAWGFITLQFRPGAGETVTFNEGPNNGFSNYGTNPTSASGTAAGACLFVGGAGNDRAAMSNPTLAGETPDGTVSFVDYESLAYKHLAAYAVFASGDTGTYATTSAGGVWGAALLVFDISSGAAQSPVALILQQH